MRHHFRYGMFVMFALVGCSNGNTNTNTNNIPTPAPAPTPSPSGKPFDCQAYVQQAKLVTDSVQAGVVTQAEALKTCENTMATQCTADDVAKLVNPVISNMPDLACEEQYAQFLSWISMKS